MKYQDTEEGLGAAPGQEEERESLGESPPGLRPPKAASAPAPGRSSVLSPERPLMDTGLYVGRFLSGFPH